MKPNPGTVTIDVMMLVVIFKAAIAVFMRTVYLLQQAGMTTGENLLQLGQT